MNSVSASKNSNKFSELDKNVDHMNEMHQLDCSINSVNFKFDEEESFVLHKTLLIRSIGIKGDEILKNSGDLTEFDKMKLYRFCQLIIHKTAIMIANAHNKNDIEYLNSFFTKEYQVDVASAINYKINDVMNRIFIKLKEKDCAPEFIEFVKSTSSQIIKYFQYK